MEANTEKRARSQFQLIYALIAVLLIVVCAYYVLFHFSESGYGQLLILQSVREQHTSFYDYRAKLHRNYNISMDDEGNNYTFLRLMSLNLRNSYLDQHDEAEFKHWSTRKLFVQHLVEDLQCDIIGTQEGTLQQIEFLSNDVWHAGYNSYGVGRLPSKWYLSAAQDAMNEHCTIFWNRHRFHIRDQGTFWLSDTPQIVASKFYGSSLPRIASWVVLDVAASDYHVLFISTHLGLSSQERYQQMLVILKFVEEMVSQYAEQQLLVFVVGDFNEASSMDQPLYTRLFANKSQSTLVDCTASLPPYTTPTLNFTYHAFEGVAHSARDSNHAPIDWILCSNNVVQNSRLKILDLYIVSSTRIDSRYNDTDNHAIYASDHFPVVLELVILP